MKKLFFKQDKRTETEIFIDDEIKKLAEEAKTATEISGVLSLMEKRFPKKEKISANTKAMIFANLAGILLILCFERLNVITTKALSFVLKGRV